ncbi:MAG TPA: FHA domain-containing protein [Longimicrobium sp.]|uniref:FHA domain-containing protein n=1 Tax=Longimicrobium sp. TaxID=2029185 RepID=UPI002ED9C93C
MTEEQKQPEGEATAPGTPGSGAGGEPVTPGSTTPAPEAPGAEPPIPGSITPAPETPGAAPVATPSDQGDGAGARIDPAPDPSGTPAEAGAVTDATTPTDAASGGSSAPADAAATTDAASATDSDVTLESPAAPSGDAGAGDGWSTGATEGDAASSTGTADASAEATTPVDPATAEPVEPADVAAPEVGASVTDTTAADVTASGEAPLDAPAAAPSTDPAAGAAAAPGGALSADRIQLVGESGQALTLGVRTPLGKHAVRQFGDDFNVWDTEQCVIERGADGAWQIVPGAATTNETLLNGERITAPAPLHDGDVVSVGRAEKGISKLPLTVRTA